MQKRTQSASFRAAEADGGELYIEGYFAVFGSKYKMWGGATESIDQHAFDETLNGDIRALINHDTTLVLGRTKAATVELRVDTHGLWGRINVNQSDSDAMNLHARIARGDVDQSSFGFDIVEEEVEYKDDGTVHWNIKKVVLYEISPCTFPAYEETSLSARKNDVLQIRKRQNESWKNKTKERLTKWH